MLERGFFLSRIKEYLEVNFRIMGKNWSIKVWIALLVNVLLLITTVVLSLFFYREFQKSLNERVLLQLTSIKRLKRVQVEDYLQRKWEAFENGSLESVLFPQDEAAKMLKIESDSISPVHDLTSSNVSGTLQLAFALKNSEGIRIAILDDKEIQRILLERTGMGQSGESYIVGRDFKLRTKSRFFPNRKPIEITCKTDGVVLALDNGEGRQLIKDYRGVPVFSAFHTLEFKNLKWVILSEIDEEEALKPLYDLRIKLLLIFLTVSFLAFVATLVVTRFLSLPINRMKNYLGEMSAGNYDFNIDDSLAGKELIEMYDAFKHTVESMKSSIRFSKDIGDMRLNQPFQPYSDNDILGRSLIVMRDKLKAFNESAENKQLAVRRALIEGEENERQRLAAELHDGIGPMLTSLKLLAANSSFEENEQYKLLIDQTIEEVRRITFNLLPQSLLDFGIKKSLQNYIQMLSPMMNANLSYIYHGEGGNDFSKQLKLCVFRLAQEVLNNASKHAKAENITLVITEEPTEIDFYYSDDGKGFNLTTLERKSGLSNMQARVENLNGSFNLQSSDEGTTVHAIIPTSGL